MRWTRAATVFQRDSCVSANVGSPRGTSLIAAMGAFFALCSVRNYHAMVGFHRESGAGEYPR